MRFPIQEGDVLIDNDPRLMTAPGQHKRGVVLLVESDYVFVRWGVGKAQSRILRSRIRNRDAPLRRNGYTLI